EPPYAIGPARNSAGNFASEHGNSVSKRRVPQAAPECRGMKASQGLSPAEADRLLAPLKDADGILLAVPGGADSTALLVLAAEWGRGLAIRLMSTTVDDGLRPGSRREANTVAALAKTLGVSHRILTWTGEKPATGIE